MDCAPVNKKICAVVVSPPLDMSGGIGRATGYLLGALQTSDIEVLHVDSRGRWTHDIGSAVTTLFACVELIRLAAIRKIDIAHINLSQRGSTLRKLLVAFSLRIMRVPFLLHLHGSSYADYYLGADPITKYMIRRMFRASAVVIVLGARQMEFCVRHLRVPRRRISIVPNGVPGGSEIEFIPRDPGSKLRVIFTGTLGPRKGVFDLLNAALELKGQPVSFVLMGDGDVSGVREFVRTNGLESIVEVHGWCQTAQVMEELHRSHILVLPSYAEGLPISILEAFAAGIPAISTDVGCVSDAVQPGITGELVPVGDPHSLAEVIAGIVIDEERRLNMAKNARSLWESSYAVDIFTENVRSVWLKAVSDA